MDAFRGLRGHRTPPQPGAPQLAAVFQAAAARGEASAIHWLEHPRGEIAYDVRREDRTQILVDPLVQSAIRERTHLPRKSRAEVARLPKLLAAVARRVIESKVVAARADGLCLRDSWRIVALSFGAAATQ